MLNESLFKSLRTDWETPQWLFEALDAEFGFTVDVCSSPENSKCKKRFEDGLKADWSEEIAFMNPPYGRQIGDWMDKALSESKKGATVVCLVPVRTDTRWWHRTAMKGEIRLLAKRLSFEGATNKAPFPCAIVVFRPASYTLKSYENVGCV